MSESWHPRKTEKDVAVARAGVAKYDRGWKYGGSSYVQEHDHSKPGKGGEVLNPEQIFNKTIPVRIYKDGSEIVAESDSEIARGTDARTVIQSALDVANSAGSVHIYVNEGTYNLSGPLVYYSNTKLEGAGWTSTILKLNSGLNTNVIESHAYNAGNNDEIQEGVEICNLKIDGNGSNQTGPNAGGLYARNTSRSHFHDLYIYQCYGTNFNIQSVGVPDRLICKRNKVSNVIVDKNNLGWGDAAAFNGSIGLQVSNFAVLNSPGSGLTHGSVQDAQYTNIYSLNNAGWGLSFEDFSQIKNISINGVVIRNSGAEGFVFHQPSYDGGYSEINGLVVEGAGNNGILLTGLSEVEIHGLVVEGAGINGIFLTESSKVEIYGQSRGAGVNGVRVENCKELSGRLLASGAQNNGVNVRGLLNSQLKIIAKNNNQASSSDDGVHLDGGTSLGAKNNRIEVLAFDDQATPTQRYGILVGGVGPPTDNHIEISGYGHTGSLFFVDPDSVRTRINGQGEESANAETPTAANWEVGDVVDFTDTGDGSGSGVYRLLQDGTWSQIGST